MKSHSDVLDLNEDYTLFCQESDEEKTINYVTEKIKALEQSIMSIKIEYESPSGLIIKKKDKLALQDYKILLNNFFKEIQLINSSLNNIVTSNNQRKNNIFNLSEKYKKLYHLYTEEKINKQMLSESIEQKDTQLENCEEIIKQYEEEVHSLHNKNNELMQFMTEESDLENKSEQQYLSNSTEEKKYSEMLKEKKYFEDILKELSRDRDELRKQNVNLKNNLTKKEDLNSEIIKELEKTRNNLKDLLYTHEQIKNEKCHLKVENEILKKENMITVTKLEDLKTQMSKFKSYTNMGMLKKYDYWKDYSPLESDYADTYSSQNKGKFHYLKLAESNLDIKNYRLNRVHSLGSKIHRKERLEAYAEFNKNEKM
jgi:chromosome segregation ATPase